MKAPGQISSSFKKAQCSAISEPKGCIGPRTAILTIACANSSLSWKVIEWSGGNSAHSLWKVQIYQVKQYRAASAWQSWSSIANCQVMARIVSSCCLMQGVLHPPGVAQFRTGLREEWLRPSLMKSFFFFKKVTYYQVAGHLTHLFVSPLTVCCMAVDSVCPIAGCVVYSFGAINCCILFFWTAFYVAAFIF